MFRENNIEFESVNYFTEPLTETGLRELLRKAGLQASEVLRKGDSAYKELNLSEVADQDKLIKLIAQNPGLLQRPIVEVGGTAVLARPIERALELVSQKVKR